MSSWRKYVDLHRKEKDEEEKEVKSAPVSVQIAAAAPAPASAPTPAPTTLATPKAPASAASPSSSSALAATSSAPSQPPKCSVKTCKRLARSGLSLTTKRPLKLCAVHSRPHKPDSEKKQFRVSSDVKPKPGEKVYRLFVGTSHFDSTNPIALLESLDLGQSTERRVSVADRQTYIEEMAEWFEDSVEAFVTRFQQRHDERPNSITDAHHKLFKAVTGKDFVTMVDGGGAGFGEGTATVNGPFAMVKSDDDDSGSSEGSDSDGSSDDSDEHDL